MANPSWIKNELLHSVRSVRTLQTQVDTEIAKRTAAENNANNLIAELRKLQLKNSELEGRAAVGTSRRLKDDEVLSSKLYKTLLDEVVALRAQVKSLEKERFDYKNAVEAGKDLVKKQLKMALDEGRFSPARREQYERLIKNLDLQTLLILHRSMRFEKDFR
jgi:hypothetical protein